MLTIPGEQATFRNRVDLHCHTTASDGGLAPRELVAHAAEIGLEVVAITDHDTTAGLPEALAEARRRGITVVPGVEISAIGGHQEIHFLGYLIDIDHPALQAVLTRAREARQERARKMLARLAHLGLPIEWDRLLARSAGAASIGRPHVAATLLEAGHVRSWEEAFDLWIGRGCPAYVERYKLSPEEAIRVIRQSGGLPVLAHPFTYSRNGELKSGLDLHHWLPRLRTVGLEGIEIYYPNYPRRASRQLLAIALQLGFLITGGSDFHSAEWGHGLGSIAVPWAAWEGLVRRHQRSELASSTAGRAGVECTVRPFER